MHEDPAHPLGDGDAAQDLQGRSTGRGGPPWSDRCGPPGPRAPSGAAGPPRRQAALAPLILAAVAVVVAALVTIQGAGAFGDPGGRPRLSTLTVASTGPSHRGSPAVPMVSPRERTGVLPYPIQHVFLIVMENAGVDQIFGKEPFETYLADQYAWGGDALTNGATGYYATCHPSAPNYLALTSGSSLQCNSDAYVNYSSQNNLFNVLDGAGLSWVSYAESMPTACDTANSGEYAVRHNPVPYYGDLGGPATGSVCETHNLPIANLTQDYPYSTVPPAFTYIAPNLLNDGHDSSPGVGDGFLSSFVSRLVNATWFGSSVVFIAYDESYGAQPNSGYGGLSGGPVYMVSVSNASRRIGALDAVNSSHYSLLSTIEWLLGVPATGSGADGTASFPPLTGLFNFGSAPELRISANATVGAVPFTVQFRSTASGGLAPYSYLWNFQDGGRSTVPEPAHTFGSPGIYNVTLNLSDQDHRSAEAELTIDARPSTVPPLVGTVRSDLSEGPIPLTVTFRANVTGGVPPYTTSWSFGDGGTASGPSVVHEFRTAGAFSVNASIVDSVHQVAVSSTAIDAYGPLSVGLSISASRVTVGSTVEAVAQPSGGAGGALSYTFTIDGVRGAPSDRSGWAIRPAAIGVMTIGVEVVDSAGQSANASSDLLVVENVPPSIPSASVPGGSTTLDLEIGIALVGASVAAAATSAVARMAPRSRRPRARPPRGRRALAGLLPPGRGRSKA